MPWLDHDVFGDQIGQHRLEIVGDPVGEGVIGHHPFHRCPVRSHESCGPGEEPGTGGTLLIPIDLHEREPGVTIHSHVHVVEANPCMAGVVVADGLFWVCAPAAAVGDRPSFFTSMWIMSPGAARS